MWNPLNFKEGHHERFQPGHPEGFPFTVANIYCDLADRIRGERRDNLPDVVDCLRSVAVVQAAVASSQSDGAWTDAVPTILR